MRHRAASSLADRDLQRFKHLGHAAAQSTKLNAYISFPINDLDLSAYVSDPALAKSEIQLGVFVYNLFAVVEHKGSSESGHYVAYIRRNEQWCGLEYRARRIVGFLMDAGSNVTTPRSR